MFIYVEICMQLASFSNVLYTLDSILKVPQPELKTCYTEWLLENYAYF